MKYSKNCFRVQIQAGAHGLSLGFLARLLLTQPSAEMLPHCEARSGLQRAGERLKKQVTEVTHEAACCGASHGGTGRL